MTKQYGIPYMGSKSGIAKKVCDYILYRHPEKKIFIDCCCGGLAISHYLLENSNLKIIANDLDNDLITFYNEFFSSQEKRNELYEKYGYNFIDRETYKKLTETAKGSDRIMLLSIRTFGNKADGRPTYLFGQDIELQKELLHNLIVYGNEDHLTDYFKKNQDRAKDDLETIRKRYKEVLPQEIKERDYRTDMGKRLNFMACFKKFVYYNELNNLQNFERLKHIEELNRFERTVNLERFERLQQLENLTRWERLDQLQNIEQFERLEFHNEDCLKLLDTLPLENAIVYFDPPYANTIAYKSGEETINEKIREWAIEHKDICPVYISEYTKYDGLSQCYYEHKNQTMNNKVESGKNAKLRKELLLYNDYENKNECLGDLLGLWQENTN